MKKLPPLQTFLFYLSLLVLIVYPIGTSTSFADQTPPVIDDILVGDGSGLVEPTLDETIWVDLEVQASDTLFWDNVDIVSCSVTGPSSRTVYDDFNLTRIGPIDSDTALFTGNFAMEYWFIPGDYLVEAIAYHIIANQPPSLLEGPPSSVIFHYPSNPGFGEGNYETDGTFCLTDGQEEGSSEVTVTNGGNVPLDITLCGDLFLGPQGEIHSFPISFQTQAGSWSVLGDTPEFWGTLPVLGSSLIPLQLTIPADTPIGIYTSSISLSGGAGIPITLTVIPEPGTLALLGIGSLIVAIHRKK